MKPVGSEGAKFKCSVSGSKAERAVIQYLTEGRIMFVSYVLSVLFMVELLLLTSA